jgi:hypothetical protein
MTKQQAHLTQMIALLTLHCRTGGEAPAGKTGEKI